MANQSAAHKENAMTRIYIDAELSTDQDVVLPSAARRHVVQVLRLNEGAPITLFNGRGGEFDGVIKSRDRHSAVVTVNQFTPIERESPLSITLVQGISRGERMDYTIQKAVELGVESIIPFQALRTGVRLSADRAQRRLNHWRGIIRHACEQCGRNRLPKLTEIQSLDEVLSADAFDVRIVLHPSGNHHLADLDNDIQSLLLVVGPEGGLDATEIERLHAAGWQSLGLGPRVLRTETAAITALSILQARFGDLG